MTTQYTIIIAGKSIVQSKNSPELWDILDKRGFAHPRLMRQFLLNNISLFSNYKKATNIKVELYEGGINRFDASRQPMLIRTHIMPGKTNHSLGVLLPNGNVQSLKTFLNHWQDMLVALGKEEYKPPGVAHLSGNAA